MHTDAESVSKPADCGGHHGFVHPSPIKLARRLLSCRKGYAERPSLLTFALASDESSVLHSDSPAGSTHEEAACPGTPARLLVRQLLVGKAESWTRSSSWTLSRIDSLGASSDFVSRLVIHLSLLKLVERKLLAATEPRLVLELSLSK